MNAPANTSACHLFCRGCGYALIGLPGNRCPECGRDFDPANPHTFLTHPRRVALRRIIRIVLVLLCLALAPGGYVGYLAWQVHREAKAIQILETNGALPITYDDTTPPWAKVILRGHAAWLWKRAETVQMFQFVGIPDSRPWTSPGVYFAPCKNVPQCLAAVANLKSLRDLNLFDLDKALTDNDLRQLRGLTSLQKLNLAGTGITDAGLAQLKGLTALRELYLDDTQVNGIGLAHLLGLPALREIHLDNTPVGDAGLAQLKGFTSLRRLYLNYTQVTDTGLPQLYGLTALQVLYLGDSPQVTDIGVGKLHEALPACEIHH